MKTYCNTPLILITLVIALLASACGPDGNAVWLPGYPEQTATALVRKAQGDLVVRAAAGTATAMAGGQPAPAPEATLPAPGAPAATSAPAATVAPAATARPGAPAATAAPSKWVHNPSLPVANGYPGWIRMAGQQQSDGLRRDVEITARQDQMVLIFGDSATIPSVGTVGGQVSTNSGCYLVVLRGPYVWDTQPGASEYGPITFNARSAWELHDVDASASPLVWAAAKASALKGSYPDTCGKGIDIWVK